MSLKLRDLIKQIRGCKTAAQERAIVAKECAAIRSSFSDGEASNRHRNIAKLLYIHMLGYPTQFGQMECLKLIVSPYYSDKRIGYLGLMLLLDEKQEVLTLVTNTLQNDMNHSNQYIVGLALCALGNIASVGIARDLSSEVEKLMQSTSPYIRKKAALAAVRVIRKCPDLCENFAAKVKSFLQSEKNHGVLLAGTQLVLELCVQQPALVKDLVKVVPFATRVLKTLVGTGYVPEYDVNGVTDPFLQVKLLRLLRVLGAEQIASGDAKGTEAMCDILAQVATNTESTRNVGNAVLYEVVRTIVGIPTESGLRVLAINVLGRFLANRDNNIRYVALNTLQHVINGSADGAQAIQRHRQIIVDCLKDPDISIRRRALDLVYALVDASNVRQLTRDLLNYLVTADAHFRPDIVAKLCWLIERFAPTRRWQFDTTLRVIGVSGTAIPDEVPASLCAIIAQTPDLQAYAVQRLYSALVKDLSHQDLTIIGLWCIGEYGDMLTGTLASTSTADDPEEEHATASPSQVVDLVESVLRSPHTTQATQQVALATLAKLVVRFGATADQALQARLREMIARYNQSIHLEVQQRSIEFTKLLSWPRVSASVLDRMPPPEERDIDDQQQQQGGKPKSDQAAATTTATMAPLSAPVVGGAPAQRDVLADLMGLTGGASATSTAAAPTAAKGVDVLADLLGAPTPAAMTATTPSSAKPVNPLEALLGPTAPATATGALVPDASVLRPEQSGLLPAPTLQVYAKNNLMLTLAITHPGGNPYQYEATASFVNTGDTPATDLILRVAVPKWIKLELDSASGSVVSPRSGKVTQLIKLLNTTNGQSPVLLRLRLTCKASNGVSVDETLEVGFPPSI